jgi:cell wall-associated NlpC family hydrolase
MTEEEAVRLSVVEEARSWIGTPYKSNAMVKGKVGGGVDCAMLLIGVYQPLHLMFGDYIDPRPYPPQWHVHRNEEMYMAQVLKYAVEVLPPPERLPKAGDLVMFNLGKVFAHGAIITAWPKVIHAIGNNAVQEEDISKNTIGKRALWTVPRKFFTPKAFS